jgi:hypothetical protein
MRFGAPFGVLFFQKSRSQSLATHARLPFLSASCSRLPRHDRKRWVATSGLSSLHGSCSWARGFYTANPPHTPVGFILSKGLPRFARVASPSPNCSKDRERVPLMRSCPWQLHAIAAEALQSVACEPSGFPAFAGCRPS